MKGHQTAFTLVEMLSVVAVLALTVILATPAVFEEARYREVGDALKRAGVIAAAIDTGRALGAVNPYNGSLGNFIASEGSDVADYMASINVDSEVLGSNQKNLYQVRVGQYSVEVSFSVIGSEYAEYEFPSSQRVVTQQVISGVQQDVVTWTVGPMAGDGISIAHMTNHYMNNGI